MLARSQLKPSRLQGSLPQSVGFKLRCRRGATRRRSCIAPTTNRGVDPLGRLARRFPETRAGRFNRNARFPCSARRFWRAHHLGPATRFDFKHGDEHQPLSKCPMQPRDRHRRNAPLDYLFFPDRRHSDFSDSRTIPSTSQAFARIVRKLTQHDVHLSNSQVASNRRQGWAARRQPWGSCLFFYFCSASGKTRAGGGKSDG